MKLTWEIYNFLCGPGFSNSASLKLCTALLLNLLVCGIVKGNIFNSLSKASFQLVFTCSPSSTVNWEINIFLQIVYFPMICELFFTDLIFLFADTTHKSLTPNFVHYIFNNLSLYLYVCVYKIYLPIISGTFVRFWKISHLTLLHTIKI